MQEIRINKTEDLITQFNSLPSHYIYRGHSNADWGLQSSLERLIGTKWCSSEVQTFENNSLERFKAKFHLYDHTNIVPTSKLGWLSIMQHYGVPTRLVDFTESPYVALYFALETYQPATNADFAVFALDYRDVIAKSIDAIKSKDPAFEETYLTIYPKQDEVFDNVVDAFSYDIVWVTEPNLHNERLDRQGGCFVISGNRDTRIADALDLPLYSPTKFYKYIIAHELYPLLFDLLRKVNVTSQSLYGDLDGLARAVRMEMQAYASVPLTKGTSA